MSYSYNKVIDYPMKRIKQYLPFILWAISTVIVTILALFILPVLLIWEKSDAYLRKGPSITMQANQEHKYVKAI